MLKNGTLQATILVAVIAAFAGASACASGGGARGSKCAATPGDSVYRAAGVVYRPCAVDREARLSSSRHPTFTPNTAGGQSCYTAEFEFVVDKNGKPILQTVRALRSNDPGFASSTAELIPGLIYEPAIKDGEAVNQIAAYKQTASVVKIVVPAGAPVRPPASRPPGC